MKGQTNLPLVSIVTPSFNQGEFIEATIQSVLAQDYPNIEYIVIDGASTDATVNVLQRYAEKISWISEPDRGQSDAINKGFLRARGDILAWMCSDDLYEPDTVSQVIEHFRQHGTTDMVYGECQYIDSQGQPIGKYPSSEFDISSLLPFCFIPQPTVFMRRSLLDCVGMVDADLQYAMDLDLWARVAMSGRIDFMPQVLARYRLHDGTKTVSSSSAVEREGIRVRERYLGDPNFRKCLGASSRRVAGIVYLKAAAFHFYEGDFAKTCRYMIKAAAAHPANRELWQLPFNAWRAIGKKRRRKLFSDSADGRIDHLVGDRPAP